MIIFDKELQARIDEDVRKQKAWNKHQYANWIEFNEREEVKRITRSEFYETYNFLPSNNHLEREVN